MQQQGHELLFTEQEVADLGLEKQRFPIGQAAFLFGQASMAACKAVERMNEIQQNPLWSNNISGLSQKVERLTRLSGQLGEFSGVGLSIADQTAIEGFKADLRNL